ncbi:MAG: ABC transporter substrate-binding protein, partial [Chloroflexota bacterium]
ADGPQGTLTHAHSVAPTTFNPHADQRNVSLQYLMPMYETLIQQTPDGTDFVPLLASAWEESPEGITFTLREDVVFHDGAAFNADVVVTNFDHVKESGHPVLKGFLRNVESAEALDEYSVRFNFSEVDPTFLYTFSRFAGMQISPNALETAADTPVGTGPYILNADKSSEDRVTLVFEPFADYWNPDAQGVARYEHIYVAEGSARTNALLSGDVNTATIGGGPSVRPTLEDQGMEVQAIQTTGWGLVVIDRNGNTVPEFADERVRRAISMAINRDAFFQISDIGFPSAQRSMPNMYGHSADLEMGYDLEAAKALMAEAGVSELTVTAPIRPVFQRRYTPVVSMLAEIGITVELQPIEGNYQREACQSDSFPLVICPINEGHIKHYIENRLLPTSAFNPQGYEDADIVALYEEAIAETDAAKAESLYAEISKLSVERGYINFIGWGSTSLTLNPDTVNGAEMRFLMPGTYDLRGVTVK